MNKLIRPECQPQEVDTIITLILEMRELKHKEISWLVSKRARIQIQAVCVQNREARLLGYKINFGNRVSDRNVFEKSNMF